MYDYDETIYEGLSSRLDIVRSNLADACREAGRDPQEVTLIGVSKVFPVSYAEAAFVAGLSDLGENRVQELVPKAERMSELGLDVNWHLIGTLQKNKVKYIIGKTKLIHSVDSTELAGEISKRSVSAGLVTDILLQVNVSGEVTKHGYTPLSVIEEIDKVNALDGVKVRGIMTMAPIDSGDGISRRVFCETHELFEKMKGAVRSKEDFDTLSMGMSGDYRNAILEGSTCVRIGTAIFGNRNALNT